MIRSHDLLLMLQSRKRAIFIKQEIFSVYSPQTNPFKGKNRDSKPRLVILVTDAHNTWEEKLPIIRSAVNTAKCDTICHITACLEIGRKLRTTDDVSQDLRALIDKDNFVAEIRPT